VRLYLSSFRIGNCADRLVAMAAGSDRVAVIANAMDIAVNEVREQAAARELIALEQLGFAAAELDLRNYFTDPERLAGDLAGFGAVWARGGNTFVLRDALARSGADNELIRMLRADTIVYAGYSAGVCVLAPTLRGLELVDDPDAVTQTYGDPPTWAGLGVVDHAIVPHFDSPDHPESEACGRVAEHYRGTGVAHRTLRDGEVLVIDGPDVSICG
jgi:dipeptidase E